MALNILIVTKLEQDRMPGWRLGRALISLGHLVTYQHFERINKTDFDLAIFDDNADYHIYPKLNCPCFYLAVDTTVEGGHRCVRQSQRLDYVFYAQKIAAHNFNPDRSEWLPNAHDSMLYPNLENTPTNGRFFIVTSVGNFDTRYERIQLKKMLSKRYGNLCTIVNRIYYSKIAELYNHSLFVINPTLGDLNLRTFEAMGYGAVNLTNASPMNGLVDLHLRHEENILYYRTDEEAVELIETYLGKPDKRAKIANNGYKLVNSCHTYANRANRILQVYEKDFKI